RLFRRLREDGAVTQCRMAKLPYHPRLGHAGAFGNDPAEGTAQPARVDCLQQVAAPLAIERGRRPVAGHVVHPHAPWRACRGDGRSACVASNERRVISVFRVQEPASLSLTAIWAKALVPGARLLLGAL